MASELSIGVGKHLLSKKGVDWSEKKAVQIIGISIIRSQHKYTQLNNMVISYVLRAYSFFFFSSFCTLP